MWRLKTTFNPSTSSPSTKSEQHAFAFNVYALVHFVIAHFFSTINTLRPGQMGRKTHFVKFRMIRRSLGLFTRRLLTQNVTTPFPEFPELSSHREIYEFSIKQPDEFWARVARSHLSFSRDFSVTSDFDLDRGKIEWFPGKRKFVSFQLYPLHLCRWKAQRFLQLS